MQSVIVAVEHLWGDIFRERMRKEPVVPEVHVVCFCNFALPELVNVGIEREAYVCAIVA